MLEYCQQLRLVGGNGAGSSGYMICSEQTFAALVGDLGYTAIDVQFSSAGGDDTVSTIRSMIPSDSTVSDKRITNSESQSSYYTGAVFIYGFPHHYCTYHSV